MRKRPLRLRFAAYLALYRQFDFKTLAMGLIVMQFFAGFGAIVFSFLGTFGLLLALENTFNFRIL